MPVSRSSKWSQVDTEFLSANYEHLTDSEIGLLGLLKEKDVGLVL
jgi:hypothetical protein